MLLSAVEIGVFSELAGGPQDRTTLIDKLALHPRGAEDFLDALVSLGMLERTGDRYSNTPSTDLFLDRVKPSYLGGLLEMANARLYPFGVRSLGPSGPVNHRTRARWAGISSRFYIRTLSVYVSSCEP